MTPDLSYYWEEAREQCEDNSTTQTHDRLKSIGKTKKGKENKRRDNQIYIRERQIFTPNLLFLITSAIAAARKALRVTTLHNSARVGEGRRY